MSDDQSRAHAYMIDSIHRFSNEMHRSASDMLQTVILTRETIAGSRALMVRTDRLLKREVGFFSDRT